MPSAVSSCRHVTSSQTELAQRCLRSDVGLERGGRNTGNDDGRSSGSGSPDDRVRPQRGRRPQSAWNSRSGRLPQFTFTDMDATGGDGDELYDEIPTSSNITRRKSTGGCSGSGSITTSVQQTTPKRTMRSRASQIPVRTDRLHPATINHVDDRPRRHSVYNGMTKNNSTTAIMDLSRDLGEENSSKSCGGLSQQVEPGRPKARLTTSCSEHLLTEARRRVLARLAHLPPADSERTSCRPLPGKLDPIISSAAFNDDDDDNPVFFTCG